MHHFATFTAKTKPDKSTAAWEGEAGRMREGIGYLENLKVFPCKSFTITK